MNQESARSALRCAVPVVFCMLSSIAARGDTSNESIDVVVRSEIVIEKPAVSVWPWLLDFRSWKAIRSLERVAGEPNEEGDLRVVTPCGTGGSGSYLMRIIEIVPNERLVLKLLAQDGKSYLGYAAFDLREVNGVTRLVYDIYVEYRTPGLPAERLSSTARMFREATKSKTDQEHLLLKGLVEGTQHTGTDRCD